MGVLKVFLGKYIGLLTLAGYVALFAALGVSQMRLSATRAEFAEWRESAAKQREQQAQADLAKAAENARETQRRLERQQENQREQDALVARMRRDRDDAFAAADRLRKQSADAARQWSARLADSPTVADLQAAAAAIELLTDVRSRLERAGAVASADTDAARAAGAKCERDYDALTEKNQ